MNFNPCMPTIQIHIIQLIYINANEEEAVKLTKKMYLEAHNVMKYMS